MCGAISVSTSDGRIQRTSVVLRTESRHHQPGATLLFRPIEPDKPAPRPRGRGQIKDRKPGKTPAELPAGSETET